LDILPAGALHANREDAIRYNLYVVTDGAVGIGYPKVARMGRGGRVTKPKPAKGDYRRSKKASARSLKRITMDLANKAATKAAERTGNAVAGAVGWGLVEALKKLMEIILS
jgi:hypothetical protein